MIVYGVGTLRTLRVHWTLQELKVKYQTKPIRSRSKQTQTLNYTSLHLGQKIPYLQDGKLGISESAAICIYLVEKYGDGNLIPATTSIEKRAVFYQACFYAMTELDAHTLYIIAKHGGNLVSYYQPSNEAVEVAIAGFNQQIRVADRLIESSDSYIVNEEFTVADIILCTCLMSAIQLTQQFALKIPEKLVMYAKNLKNRSAFTLAKVVNQDIH
jgi:glutathione S-transferase